MRFWSAVAFLLLARLALAQQPTVELESRVTGNQELPRVMYILPWRQPAELDFDWQPEPGIASELFQPLHRDEYLRGLNYRELMAGPAQAGSSTTQTTTE
jgi:hypothetical protein